MCANLNLIMPDGSSQDQSFGERLQKLLSDSRSRPATAAPPVAGAVGNDPLGQRLADEISKSGSHPTLRSLSPVSTRSAAPSNPTIPPDLAHVVSAWPDLSPLVRSQVLALVRAAACGRQAR